MAAISSPHDSFFRAIFGNRQMAVDYFQSALPAHIIALLDFSTLRRVPDSYVSGELEKTMSDVIYTCFFYFRATSSRSTRGIKSLRRSYRFCSTTAARNGNTGHWIGCSMIWGTSCLYFFRNLSMFTITYGIHRML